MSTQPAVEPRQGVWPAALVERAVAFWEERSSLLLLTIAWTGGGLLMFNRLNQGWLHHDDGSLAHAAQRVLAGELPHRDFAELYTGGLAFLDAGLFRLLGEDLFVLRLPLFGLFLAFIPCFFYLARRMVGPLGAFLATIVAISWSFPAYPAPMPSWYLLFFSVFGACAVVRYFDTRRWTWLLLAGVFGGLGLSIKIVAIWFVVAVVLALAVANESRNFPTDIKAHSRLRAIVIATASGSLGLVLAVLSKKLDVAALVSLVAPIAALCFVCILLAVRGDVGTGGRSIRSLVREATVFLLGVALPVSVLLVPYVATGSVGSLIDGVLIAPQSRFEFAYRAVPGPSLLLWAAPVVAYVVGRAFLPPSRRRIADVCASSLAAAVVVGLMTVASTTAGYIVVWQTARALAPLAIVFGAIVLARHRGMGGADRNIVVLVLLVAGFMALVQFPFSAPIYFLYVAPLTLLAGVAAVSYSGAARMLPGVVLVILALFGLRFIDSQSFWTLGVGYRADEHTVVLDEGRASIRSLPRDERAYRHVLALVRKHSSGRFIYAGPDAPEVYFLSNLRNPTRSVMDFLDSADTARRGTLLTRLGETGVNVIVINRQPLQSAPLEQRTVRQLRALYPSGTFEGRFEVRWRGDSAGSWVVPSGPWRELTRDTDLAVKVEVERMNRRFESAVARDGLRYTGGKLLRLVVPAAWS